MAAKEVITSSYLSRIKVCPRSAYLGLCEEGLVEDVPAGDYGVRQGGNKRYAIQAVIELRTDPSLADDTTRLWETVGEGKRPNGQMDVVLSLWNSGLIKK